MNLKESFIIKGFAGERKLNGTVRINGAKNSALKAISASILFDGPVSLENIPQTSDIDTILSIMEKLGARIERNTHDKTIKIDSSSITKTDIDADLAKGMRASVVLTGPLLTRFGSVSFPAPGGCVIGFRSIDLFLSGYEKMGSIVKEEDSLYKINSQNKLIGTEIFFNKISVGGTETLMMAAVLAEGTTVLKNCAMEPEIANIAEWLNACGAKISGIGTPTITIQGSSGKLLSAKVNFITIPDRIEAGSYLILGACCAEKLIIEHCQPKHLESVIELLRESGVTISTNENSITVQSDKIGDKCLKSLINVRTHEYPGLPTDLQAPFVTFLTQTLGETVVFETIFEARFKYIEDLMKMGAFITVMNPREILLKGPMQLSELPQGEELTAHDIRAGFAVVMASLLGRGSFTINNIHLIDRGYEDIEGKLRKLGANIERVVS